MAVEPQFYLRPINRRIPLRRHPDFEALRQDSAAWTREHLAFALGEQVEEFIDYEHARWTCQCFPDAPRDRLRNLCHLTEYFFALDDTFTRSGDRDARRFFAEILDVLAGRDAGPSRYHRVLADVWGRITPALSPAQLTRYVGSVAEFLRGFAVEIATRAEKRPLDYESYMALRRASVSGRPYFILIEYALGIELSQAFAECAELGALNDIALDQLILVNDLFSLRKEHHTGDPLNAIAVLRQSEGLDLQSAVDRVCDAIERQTALFLEARGRLLHQEPDRRAYAMGLSNIISGNLDWSYRTPRYHGKGYRWNGEISGIVTLGVDKTVLEKP
jgi:hypothetical protein